MLHTEYQASKPSGSEEEEGFEYFSMRLYDLNQGPPGMGPSWFLGPLFEHTW